MPIGNKAPGTIILLATDAVDRNAAKSISERPRPCSIA